MRAYIAVKDEVNGNIKVASNGQVNSYPNTDSGYEHYWYNPFPGQMGWHGENASPDDKAFMADVARK